MEREREEGGGKGEGGRKGGREKGGREEEERDVPRLRKLERASALGDTASKSCLRIRTPNLLQLFDSTYLSLPVLICSPLSPATVIISQLSPLLML